MAELKTKATTASVTEFLNQVADESTRADCEKIAAMMQRATGATPKMWGANIIGFGAQTLRYETGRELEWMEVGFSPRKQNITLYIMSGFALYDELLAKIGKHKIGKSCLYIKRLSDVDETALQELITQSINNIRKIKEEI